MPSPVALALAATGVAVSAPAGAGAPTSLSAPGPLERAHVDRLSAAGRLGTPSAELVLFLARRIEHGEHSGTALAALAGRLCLTMDRALQGAPAAPDALDDLVGRRRRRFVPESPS